MTDRPDLRPPDSGDDPDVAPEGGPDGGGDPRPEPIDPASTGGPSGSAPPPQETSADAPPPPPPATSSAPPAPPAPPPPAVDAPPTAPPPPPPVAPPTATEPDTGDAPVKPSPWKAVALIGAVLLVGLGAFFLLKDDGETAAPSATTTTPASSDDFIKVRDAQAGFSVEHPESWKPLREADGEERLLLTAGGQNYFQLKIRSVDPATAGAEIQTALEGLEMLTEPRSVTLSGQPATLYLYYTPVTETSPVKGVHVHYFVLQGERLFSLVFQALPAENLNNLVPVFDRVAKSFTIEASTAPPAGDSTTTTTTG